MTDITYIVNPRVTAYLCTVIDLFDNQPVVRKVSNTIDKNLTMRLLRFCMKSMTLEMQLYTVTKGFSIPIKTM